MAVMAASKTVVGVFDQVADAKRVVSELENAGFSREDISVIANKNSASTDLTVTPERETVDAPATGSHVGTDAGIGAALGGVGGLLLSFAGLAIPGIGPVLAIGPIVAALSGAGIGAVAGGIIGALTESGVPEHEAQFYAEGVRRGHCLVTVRTDESNAERARDVMDQNGAIDVEGRVGNWRERGWNQHEAGAEPFSADELRREREYYSAANRQASEWTREAHDIGDTLPRPVPVVPAPSTPAAYQSARTGEVDLAREAPTQVASPTTSPEGANPPFPAGPETGTPLYGDSTEAAFRKPDRATVKVEQGFDRAMESASQSARRLGSRVYDTRKS
jgi:hypothetical protein